MIGLFFNRLARHRAYDGPKDCCDITPLAATGCTASNAADNSTPHRSDAFAVTLNCDVSNGLDGCHADGLFALGLTGSIDASRAALRGAASTEEGDAADHGDGNNGLTRHGDAPKMGYRVNRCAVSG